MIKKIELKTHKVSYYCDSCGGVVQSTFPYELKPQEHSISDRPIKHKCDNCNKEYWLNKLYPHIKYSEE